MKVSANARYRIAATCAVVTALLMVGALVYGVVHKGPSANAGLPEFSPLRRALENAIPADYGFVGWTNTHVRVGSDCLSVVVADSTEERRQGLRGRSSLAPYDGMLFVFPADFTAAFTMSGTREPIDITWYSADGEPVDSVHMTPCEESDAVCPRYESDRPYRLALERFDGPSTGTIVGC